MINQMPCCLQFCVQHDLDLTLHCSCLFSVKGKNNGQENGSGGRNYDYDYYNRGYSNNNGGYQNYNYNGNNSNGYQNYNYNGNGQGHYNGGYQPIHQGNGQYQNNGNYHGDYGYDGQYAENYNNGQRQVYNGGQYRKKNLQYRPKEKQLSETASACSAENKSEDKLDSASETGKKESVAGDAVAKPVSGPEESTGSVAYFVLLFWNKLPLVIPGANLIL